MKARLTTLILSGSLLAGCGGGPDEQQPIKTLQTPETVRRPAKPGVGAKGRGYGTGPVATPVAALFSVRERLALMSIAQPMNSYKADKGHFPKSHEEFWKEIIEKHFIKLPPLRPGQRYVYDPEKAAKMVSYDIDDPPLMVVGPP